MNENTVGGSGWNISSIGLGTLGWGRDIEGDDAHALLRIYCERGGNVLEIAPHYGEGRSLGLIRELLECILPTPQIIARLGIRQNNEKFYADCSRRSLLLGLDSILSTLDKPYVDCLIVGHYDVETPLTEVAGAIIQAVRDGRALYAGVSNFPAWAFTRVRDLVEAAVPGTFIAYEGEYSLLERGVEREVLPAAYNLGCGFIAYSPLACGVLTAKYQGSTPPDSRAATSHLKAMPLRYMQGMHNGILDAIYTAADGLGWSPLEVAMAWITGARGVSCTLAGPRTSAQLEAILDASKLTLPTRIRAVLNEISYPAYAYPDPASGVLVN